MKSYHNTKVLCGVTTVLAAFFILMMCLTDAAWRNASVLNANLGITTSIVENLPEEGGETSKDYFKSEYGDTSMGNGNNPDTLLTQAQLDRLIADEKAFIAQEQTDGSVLLRNENDALPLSKDSKITLLGHAVAQPYYKGASGGGFIDRTEVISLYDALSEEGFNINQTVFDAYVASSSNRDRGYNVSTYALGKEPASFYTAGLKSTFSEYGDAAVIMFARESGEYRDMPKSESANDNGEEGISHLALHKNGQTCLKWRRIIRREGYLIKLSFC